MSSIIPLLVFCPMVVLSVLNFLLLIDDDSIIPLFQRAKSCIISFLFCSYAIVRDMTAAGLGLNKYCYAALIIAHKNKSPLSDDTASKVITVKFFEVGVFYSSTMPGFTDKFVREISYVFYFCKRLLSLLSSLKDGPRLIKQMTPLKML